MASKHAYAISRSAYGRPTVQHKVTDYNGAAICGVVMIGWQIHWMSRPMPVLLCKRCERLPW